VWSVDVVRPDGGRDTFAVHRGFVQVAGTKISILSDVSEAAGDIDVERARVAKAGAESALSADKDDREAVGALARADVRLTVAGAEG
jgi:F-type H+-transporting ATPase subunit epsilon